MKRNYIGIASTFHDPALAIVSSGGEVVFAEATERYLQNKRATNCPADDVNRIERLLDEYREPGADLVVATPWSGGPMFYGAIAALAEFREVYRRLRCRAGDGVPSSFSPVPTAPGPATFRDWLVRCHVNYSLQTPANLNFRIAWAAIQAALCGGKTDSPKLFTTRYDHHLAHAAAACYASPFRDAVCAVFDGYGQLTSTGYYAYSHSRVRRLDVPQKSPASLGFLYGFVCMACGFDPIKGEEWKVMGLAPYGKFDPEIYRLLQSVQRVDGLRLTWDRQRYETREALAALGRYDRADLACTGQQLFQELTEELLNNLAALGVSDNLVLGGGCALNSTTNGLLLDRTPFRNLYVFCAPGDDGNAVGAALLAYVEDNPGAQPPVAMLSPYLGSTITAERVEQACRIGGLPNHSNWPGTIHEKAARLLADGKILGWVQGRAEFGPRALGNRSILADPRRLDIKDVLNDRVKFREEFRPFAPSILHEFGPEYFEHYQESPYMDRTLRFREAVADRVPGVVHANRSGRLQTVKREWNERYYDLIRSFHELTGVPIVLNTSFNVMGKPIVHSVEDAIAVFYTSGLDALILGDTLIEK